VKAPAGNALAEGGTRNAASARRTHLIGGRRVAPRPVRLLCLVALCLAGLSGFSTGAALAAVPSEFGGPEGTGAGQFLVPNGIGIDQGTGDAYISDRNNSRIDKFGPEGEFLLSFGWGVADGVTQALQTCGPEATPTTTACFAGVPGTGAGQLGSNSAAGVAVDNDVASPSHGDVYVVDANNSRIEKFGPAGQFILSFGEEGAGPGQFERLNGRSVAVGVDGDVYVGDENRVQRFSPSGVVEAQIPIAGAGFIENLAVDSTSDLYAQSSALAGVRKYDPSGTELGTPRDELGQPDAIAVGPVDELLVDDSISPHHVLAFDTTGNQTSSFDAGAESGRLGIAFADAADALYLLNETRVRVVAPPEPGPLVLPGSESASEVGTTTVTLAATINPEGPEVTTYSFEYGTTTGYGQSSPAPPAQLMGEPFEDQPVASALAGLLPRTTYDYRVVAENAAGETAAGPNQEFTTLPPVSIDSTSATEITSTSATLEAALNPNGIPGRYHFEFDTTAYSVGGPSHGTSVPVPEGSLGSATVDVTRAASISGLAPSTTYHYRVVASNSLGTVDGPDRAFTTQGANSAFALPDHRAWEMVSPIEKGAGGISSIDQPPYDIRIQAAADGEAIAFGSPVAFADPASSPPGNQYLAVRSLTGWSTENIGLPTNAENNSSFSDPPYKAFSTDLESAVVSGGSGRLPTGTSPTLPVPPLPGTGAVPGFGNYYLRDDTAHSFTALLTEANRGEAVHPDLRLAYEDATPDLSHIVFGEEPRAPGEEQSKNNLYEWSSGAYQLINFLPGQTLPTPLNEGLGDGAANEKPGEGLMDIRALSADGSRAVWAAGDPGSEWFPEHTLDIRINIGRPQSALEGGECTERPNACTLQVDASEGGEGPGGGGEFLGSSADDSQVFFTDHQRLTADSTADQNKGGTERTGQRGDLYRFEAEAPAGHRLTDLSVDHSDPGGAEVVGVAGVSDNGAYVYFVANGVLASNVGVDGGRAAHGSCIAHQVGSPGELLGKTCNLYLSHDGVTTFIATVENEDNNLASDVVSLGGAEGFTGLWQASEHRDDRLSTDGTHLAFVSQVPLTGYDNVAANGTHCGTTGSGAPNQPKCAEVYLYQAPSAGLPEGALSCLSCNPTGQRPLGLSGIADPSRVYPFEKEGYYLSRALSADGSRVFFDSYDALVPQDTNGKLDVYEWEATGEGSCVTSAQTFDQSADGCVDLISSGTSDENSDFMDASADGSDVFFRTSASLVRSDPGSTDLYDAREYGGVPEPPPPSASCEGDACQTPPAAPAHPSPGTALVNGPGNLTVCAKGKVKKGSKCVKKQQKSKKKKHRKSQKRKSKKPTGKKQKRAAGNVQRRSR
jgi:hypothetical protein